MHACVSVISFRLNTTLNRRKRWTHPRGLSENGGSDLFRLSWALTAVACVLRPECGLFSNENAWHGEGFNHQKRRISCIVWSMLFFFFYPFPCRIIFTFLPSLAQAVYFTSGRTWKILFSWNQMQQCSSYDGVLHSRPLCVARLSTVVARALPDNNRAATKAPKFVLNTESIWKSPALSLIWMFHIFRNASCPPPQNSDEETLWLPRRMWPVFLSSHPRTQKCLQTVREARQSNRGEERKKQREGKQEGTGRGRNRWMEI